MDLPKCRTCGERHRLGPCPSTHTKSRGDGLRVSTSHQAKVRPDQPVADVGVAPSPRDANPVAKATKGKTGTAGDAMICPVRRSTAGTGLRVGEAVAVQPATSEIMDVTAGRDRQPIESEIDGKPFTAKEPGSLSGEGTNPPAAGAGASSPDIGGCEKGSGLCEMSGNASGMSPVSPHRSGDEVIFREQSRCTQNEAGGDQGRDSQVHPALRQLSRKASLGGETKGLAGETAPKFDRAKYHREYMREYMRKRREAKKSCLSGCRTQTTRHTKC